MCIQHHAYNALENAPVIALSSKNAILTESYSALTPITKLPGGPADEIGARIAKRLSKESGKDVTVGMMIEAWLRTRGIISVTYGQRLLSLF